jgi:hypothetical protein
MRWNFQCPRLQVVAVSVDFERFKGAPAHAVVHGKLLHGLPYRPHAFPQGDFIFYSHFNAYPQIVRSQQKWDRFYHIRISVRTKAKLFKTVFLLMQFWLQWFTASYSMVYRTVPTPSRREIFFLLTF